MTEAVSLPGAPPKRRLRFSLATLLLLVLLIGSAVALALKWHPWGEVRRIPIGAEPEFCEFNRDGTALFTLDWDQSASYLARVWSLPSGEKLVEKTLTPDFPTETTRVHKTFNDSWGKPVLAIANKITKAVKIQLINPTDELALDIKVTVSLSKGTVKQAYETLSQFGVHVSGPTWLQDEVSISAENQALGDVLREFGAPLGLEPVSAPDGVKFVSRHETASMRQPTYEYQVRLWRLPECELIHEWRCDHLIGELDRTCDGEYIVALTGNGRVAWNIATGERVGVVPGKLAEQRNVEVHDDAKWVPLGDGSLIAGITLGGRVQLRDATSNELVTEFGIETADPPPQVVNPFDFGPSGPHHPDPPIISARGDKVAFPVYIDGGLQLAVFERRRPEYWWGVACLPEFWLTVIFALALLRSLLRDRRAA